MKNAYLKFSLTVIAASLMSAYGTASAAEDSEINELTKPSSTVSVGVGSWDHERQQLGIYDGMSENQPKLLLDADIQQRDDETGTWTTLSARNLGLETRDLRAEYLKQGNWGAALEFDQIESLAPYTINTNHLGIGSVSQTTGANIPNTAIGSGSNYHFGTKREKFGVSGYKNLMENLDLRIRFSTETKDGERITTNGSNAFVADLIDWTTDKLEAVVDYSGERLQLSGGYNGSWFKNKNDFGFVALGTTPITQPLDNQAHQLFLNGGYNFAPSTRGTVKLAYTHGTQDENLPTSRLTTNATFGNISKLDGEIDTTLLQLGVSSRPIPKLNLVASWRYYESKDKTPQFGIVRNTLDTADVTINSTPYSYETNTGKLEGTYDLSNGYSATAGIDFNQQDRTVYSTILGATYNAYVPLRADTDETTYRLQLRKNLSETLNGSLAYLYGDRDGGDYTTSTFLGTAQVSPVHVADRERQKIRLALDWAPMERIDVQLSVEAAEDEYGNGARSQGLQEGKANVYSLDVGYRLTDDWQLTGWYSHNTNDAHFVNYGSTANNTVTTNTFIKEQNDTGDAVGLNLNGKINAKTQVGAEISWSNDKTAFEQSSSDGTAVTAVAPDISSKLTRIKLFANYALQKNSDVRVDLAHERWSTNDWQWLYQDGRAFQYGTTADGTTVLKAADQDATFVGVRFVQRFQ